MAFSGGVLYYWEHFALGLEIIFSHILVSPGVQQRRSIAMEIVLQHAAQTTSCSETEIIIDCNGTPKF